VVTVQASDQGTHEGLGLLVTCAIDSGMSGPVIEERDNRIVGENIGDFNLPESSSVVIEIV
jgi:hypothetical protein